MSPENPYVGIVTTEPQNVTVIRDGIPSGWQAVVQRAETSLLPVLYELRMIIPFVRY